MSAFTANNRNIRTFVAQCILLQKHIQHTFLPLWCCGPSPVNDLLSLRCLDHTTWTQHSRQDSSGRKTRPTQRNQSDITIHKQQTDMHRRDSKTQSQQTSGKNPPPYTSRILGPAIDVYTCSKYRHAGVLTLSSNI